MDVTVAWYAESMGFMLPCQRRCSVQNLSPCLIIWCTDVFRQQAYLLTSCVGEGNPQRPPVFSASTHPFPPFPSKRQNFLSSKQKVKARLLNIVLAKNTRVKMPHQCFFTISPWWRTIAFVGDSRAVQFPVSAFDKDREVEGCVAEASIRSRGLKTEAAAGDIPGWKA